MKVISIKLTVEGAGVQLGRGFGPGEARLLDPFLLFDDFTNTDESAYRQGFPMHPHRGIETVTYILKGEVSHKDSLGNEGSIKAGEVQWMTAGSGIMHEEMPIVHEEGIQGFQLWLNLPQKNKMMTPRYQEIKSEMIPCLTQDGCTVRVIAGEYTGAKGPVQGLVTTPTYLDIQIGERSPFSIPTEEEDSFFIYVFEGRLSLRDDRSEFWVGKNEIGVLSGGKHFTCAGGKDGARLLLIGGKKLKEEVAWRGSIVMNTEEELIQAVEELNNDTFIKKTTGRS